MRKNSLFQSFCCAWEGIVETIKQERNIKIHLFAAILAITLAWYKSLEPWRLAVLLVIITLVIVTEIINSAVERIVDLTVNKQFHPLAREAKNMAAGAVLATALAAILVGAVVFFY